MQCQTPQGMAGPALRVVLCTHGSVVPACTLSAYALQHTSMLHMCMAAQLSARQHGDALIAAFPPQWAVTFKGTGTQGVPGTHRSTLPCGIPLPLIALGSCKCTQQLLTIAGIRALAPEAQSHFKLMHAKCPAGDCSHVCCPHCLLLSRARVPAIPCRGGLSLCSSSGAASCAAHSSCFVVSA